MPAISWETIENAIHAWVVAGSGLAEDHVIWTGQSGAVPDSEYIELSVLELQKIGHDWKVKDNAPDAVEGAELRVRARGMRTIQLQLQCFGDSGTGNAPLHTLGDVISALELHHYDIGIAGAGLGDVSQVRTVGSGATGAFEPRSLATVTFHVGSEIEVRQGALARLKLTAIAQNQIGDTINEITDWIPRVEAFSSGFSVGFEGP